MDEEFTLDDKPKKRLRQQRRPPLTPEEKLRASSPTVRLEGRFQIEFKKRWGFPVILSEARDRKILKGLHEQWGERATGEAIVAFFRSTDPRVRRCRFYNVPDFAYWAPTIRMAMNGGDMHERTASNAHEVAKAMGRADGRRRSDAEEG